MSFWVSRQVLTRTCSGRAECAGRKQAEVGDDRLLPNVVGSLRKDERNCSALGEYGAADKSRSFRDDLIDDAEEMLDIGGYFRACLRTGHDPRRPGTFDEHPECIDACEPVQDVASPDEIWGLAQSEIHPMARPSVVLALFDADDIEGIAVDVPDCGDDVLVRRHEPRAEPLCEQVANATVSGVDRGGEEAARELHYV